MKQIPYKFECMPYGELEQITPLISKGRLRIYYIGKNRNKGYITQVFSDELQKYLPYTPVVGIFDKNSQDFKGHNLDRNVANTYGLVPENPNAAWEVFLDKDGVKREYLCCDVYLYTGRYEAAKKIIGKPHSMELNRDSLQGFWKMIDNDDEYYVYTHGFFDGLCVLGERNEPCFEGSAFFEKNESNSIIDLLEKYVKSKTNKIEDFSKTTREGITTMVDEIKDVVSLEDEIVTSPAETAIEMEISTEENVEEVETNENEAEASFETIDVETEDSDNIDAIAAGMESESGNETEVAENLEDDTEEDTNVEVESDSDFVIASDASFDEVCKYFNSALAYHEQASNEILELRQRINTLETEARDFQASLKQYQLAEQEALNNQKQELINDYADLLSIDVINNFKTIAANYSIDDLRKEILFEIDKENPSFFKRSEEPKAFSSFRTKEENGIIGILNKHKNKI